MARYIALRPMTLFGLSALMIFYAHLNFYEDKQRPFNTLYRLLDISYNSNGSEPFLTIFRDKHRKSFLHQRVEDNPLTYKYLHVYMAVFWSIVMPLQHIDSFRVKYPTAHRVCGYLTLTGSFLLAATGLTFPFRDLSYSSPAPLSFHYAFGKWYLPFITFNQGLFFIAIPQLFTLYKTVKHARRRAFAKHRYWAVLHTTSCYVIHLFRVYLAIAFILGTVLAKSPLTFQTALGVPQGLREKEEAERAVFAFCTVLAGITGFAWTRKILSKSPKQM